MNICEKKRIYGCISCHFSLVESRYIANKKAGNNKFIVITSLNISLSNTINNSFRIISFFNKNTIYIIILISRRNNIISINLISTGIISLDFNSVFNFIRIKSYKELCSFSISIPTLKNIIRFSFKISKQNKRFKESIIITFSLIYFLRSNNMIIVKNTINFIIILLRNIFCLFYRLCNFTKIILRLLLFCRSVSLPYLPPRPVSFLCISQFGLSCLDSVSGLK